MLEVTIHEYVSPWWCDCSLRSHQNYDKGILPYMRKKCMCMMFALPYQIEICLELHLQMQYVPQPVQLTHQHQSTLSVKRTVLKLQNEQGK